MNTAPTSSGCLLLIDSRVTDYQDIINATQSGVQHLIFHVEDMNTEANPFEYIQTRISELGVSAYTNVGLIQHNMRLPVYSMFGSGSFDATIADVETVDPTLQTWAGVSGFITHLKNTYGVQNFDMMACALYSNPDWKYVIDTLAVQTGVTVRASTDDTGAAALGGDWFLESHTGVNLKDVYFTEAIEDFRGVLIYSTKYDSRSYFSTKSIAVGKAVAWGATGYGGGTDVNTITGGVITSGVVALYSIGYYAFAALKTNGSVSTWGSTNYGGNQTVGGALPSVANDLSSGVVEVYQNAYAFAALKNTGTVITWGNSDFGGSSTSVVLTNVVDIFSNGPAFAALKSNGSVVTWPSPSGYGGDSSTATSGLTSGAGVVSVNMANTAGAALKSDGSVITWPTTGTTGGNSSAVTSSISSGVVAVHTDYYYTFAALKNDGSVITWGTPTGTLATSVTLSNIVTIHSHTNGAYTALNISGGVVTWGVSLNGGNSSGKSLSSNVVKVYSSGYAFAALKFDGSVVTWGGSTSSAYGGNSTSVASDLSSGVVAVYGNNYAFAALKSNGKVITWGDALYGANSSSVATDISAGIVGIYVTQNAFAALRNDGKLITWGDSSYGGNSSSVASDISAGVVSVNNTYLAFAAITSSATTFDLSMSYYRDIDRYNILRNKENRRRVNLTTLNNNVFTLSSTRDIQKFNYTITSGNSFRIIVPDYVSSNYSIISTATLPSPAAANYIIACEEGEPVTISGVTYINYGAFVYRRNIADNTFTKMTSAVIDGVTYKLYGGDGLFSSGIALQYRFGTFAVPAKTFGDASFNITAPVTDSSGAFTYTSSDTTVATVTTGGTVTIIKAGTTTITATQAANGRFTSDSITASLVVSKIDSTLGALTVPAKIPGDAPFTITTPTSTNSSIVSPVYTITTATSMIVPPPAVHINPLTYGGGWYQEGGFITGDATGINCGYSVSMSADGTIVAIGYPNSTSTSSYELGAGLVRIFKSDITKTTANGLGPIGWSQLGGDIYGEAGSDYSGSVVKLSADGTVVAIAAYQNDGTSGTVNTGDDRGHVRVYKYTPTKTIVVTSQTDPIFGPVGWTRMGADIDGHRALDWAGFGLSISADGNIIGIGARYNDGPSGTSTSMGQVRIYRYTQNKAAVTNVNDASFGPAGWTRIGSDIYGDAANDEEGYSIALSADGTTFVTGAAYYSGGYKGRIRTYVWNGTQWIKRGSDIMGKFSGDRFGSSVAISANGNIIAGAAYMNDGSGNAMVDSGSVCVYYWNTNINDWTQQGGDIYGEATGDTTGGMSISLSSDGTIIAIGAPYNDGTSGTVNTGDNRGHVRIYKYDVNKTQAQLNQGVANFGPVGWTRISNQNGYMSDLDGGAANDNFGYSVSLSSDGTKVLIGEIGYDEGGVMSRGLAHVRYIATTNALTYSSSNSRVADICGNLLFIKGVDGTSTITASQTGNTVTGRLDVSGTTYTLQYNPIAFTSGNTSVATISTYGTVTLAGAEGTSTITATQPETLNYSTRSVTGTLVVSKIDSTLGTFTIPAKIVSDAPFTLTAPTSSNSSITSPTYTITSTSSVIVPPPDIRDLTYGTTWMNRGGDIYGEAAGNYSGWSVAFSADGTVVAIGAPYANNPAGTLRVGHVRVYKYNPNKLTEVTDQTSASFGPVGWDRLGRDIDGEAVDDYSGWSVALSADGTTVAIGAYLANNAAGTADTGHVRVYKYNQNKVAEVTDQTSNSFGPVGWDRLGRDIDGVVSTNAQSGYSVALSADGTMVAIGARYGTSAKGHVRVYKYNQNKVAEVTDQTSTSFGPVGWDRLGRDIDGEALNDQCGWSVALSADGTTLAIGAPYANNAAGTLDTGHVRVYKYNQNKVAEVTDQSSNSFGPIGWDRLGRDIDGEALNDQSGYSVALSSDGTTVAIGARYANKPGGTGNTRHVRVYKYNQNKLTEVTDQTSNSFGPVGWDRLGWDIDGEDAGDQNLGTEISISVALSSDGTTVAIGANTAKNYEGIPVGHVRVYKYNPNKLTEVTNQTLSNFGPVGWDRVGIDIDGKAQYGECGWSVALSSDGTTVAIGARSANSGIGVVRVYNITMNNALTYSSSNSTVADICGNRLIIKGVNGSSTITASQTGNTVTARLDVSGTTYTLQYNPITYTIENTGLATVSTYGTVTLAGVVGTSTITATQLGTLSYATRSVTGTLVVSQITPTISALTAPPKNLGDPAFDLTAPTSNSDGTITYTSSNPAIATVTSGGTVTVIGAGSTTITATLAASGNYSGGSVTASLVVSAIAPTIGALSAPAKNFGDASFNLTAPTSNSDGAFTYTSSAPEVATVTSTGGTVTVIGAGSTTITATQAASADGNYTGGSSVTASLVISAIAPTIGALSAPAKNFGDASFNLTAPTSNSDGAFTYTSSAPGVATVTTGGMVTVIGAGSTTITATQAATTNYLDGSVTASLVVSAIAPTIGALSAPAKNFGDASFNLTAPTSNSDGAFTYTSSAPGVATVTSGGTVTVVGAGSTTITATQAATTNYLDGSVTASLVVSSIAPTIGALSAPAKNFGDASFNLTAPTSNSDGAFTYTSSAPGVATVTTGGTVTVIGAGSTTITATQAASADGNYTGGSSVTASLVVSAITPTYQSISQITKIYSTDVSFSLTSIMSGVSNSSGAYTFSTTSAAIDICGGVATILAYTPSAITITATQAASGNYNALGSTTFAVLVNRKVPSYGAFSVPAATYEDAPFSIAAYAPTTDSTGVPFTYTSSEPTVATINSDGTVITIIGQGYTTITASQAAGGNYAASSTTTSFLVNRAAPTFLKAFTITNKTFGDASFSLLPFTEGLDNTDGTYHFTSSNAQLVSISEIDSVTATIHAYTPTPITIYVAIDACGNYAASSTSGTLTVIRAIPTFGAFTVPAKNFRDASFNITAPTSNSSGTFTYSSSNTSVATVTSGGVLTVVSAGSTTITATQEINGNYTTRDISASLVVSPIAPTIGALTAPAKNFGDASFNLTAPTSDSGGAITYTSSNTAVATVTSGGTVTVVGVGSTTITATQAATTNYSGGSVTASLVVSASLSNFSVPGNKYYGDASFNLVDPDTTDNTVGFTFASSNTSVATLSGTGGRTVTIVGAGSTTITATQAATANRGELNISATLVVRQATPVITLASITKSYGNSSFRLSPSSTNTDTTGGSVFTFSSDNIAVVSFLDASLVRINGIGTATISITQAASANFTDASSSVVITVNKGASGFSAATFAVAANKTFGDAAFAITTVPISSSTGAVTYTSSDENVATITSSGSGNAITLVGQGTVTFSASQAASALYTADTKTSNTLTVARKTAALSRDTPSTDTISKGYGSANFSVIATNESNGAFSFTSSNPSFATIDASTGEVSIVAVGSTTLTATRAQTAQYNASSISWTLNITRGTTTLTGISSLSRNVALAPFTVTATSASNGAVSYALQDPSSTILTIHPTTGRIRLKAPGSAVIVASQGQGTLYEAPTSITATITVIQAGIILRDSTVTDSYGLDEVDLSGASLANSTITNTNFSSSNLGNSNFNNSNVTNANMTSADLSGSTMRNATMNGVNFTSAGLQRTDLSGANVRNSIFNSADLSGSTLVRLDASGASFINANLSGANLSNADFTNANMTNANIDGADITNVTFTIPQKLQLLKNRGNRTRSEIQVSQTTGNNILAVVSAGSAVRDIANIASATFKVISPTTTTFVSGMNIIDIILDTDNYAYFYFPIKDDEYFRIQGIIYRIDTTSTPLSVRNYATGAAVENTNYGIKAIRLLAGSLTIIVNSQNTLSRSSFVVPSPKINTDAPFSPTTLPTSNSTAPIVYSSSNTSIATIHSSTGIITPVAGSSGFVRFTASQVANQTHESASIMSNELLVNRLIDFTLVGLNQTFSLSTLATLDASSISLESTDATAVFYVRLSDMTNLFQYQTDSFDVNNVDASDIKYYMFHRSTPAEFRINPSHAMMNKTESAGMLGSGVQEITANKSLVKHDFIRYIALRLFNTHYGVDLFQNEQELHENLTYLGETIQHNIDNIITGVSTTSASESMAYDASGNKYLTNDASGNTNLCRELMRQVAASDPSRFYNHGGNTTGLRNMPLEENDSINFKLTITAAAGQNILTGVSVIPSRTYLIKMMLKNTVNTSSNDTNTAVTDSEMYPNSYPYSTSVTTYAPTVDSSGVYNVYSPPAPIPFSRFGFNGWYYANTSAWVNVAPQVRDRVKWIVPSNSVGSSTVSNLQYIRMNLKVFNKTSLPFLVVYTQAGSYRKYTISAPNSLANGTVYSFYMNFNSYSREPATVGATNAALTYSGVSNGSFADSEIISLIAIESDNSAAASSVEFTLSRIVVGVAGGEKEYGFSGGI